MIVYCPKCQADVSGTYEAADYSCGINPGWYCDICGIGIAEHEIELDYFGDEVSIGPINISEIKGTPLSEISSQPGKTSEEQIKYQKWVRISRSWGYD